MARPFSQSTRPNLVPMPIYPGALACSSTLLRLPLLQLLVGVAMLLPAALFLAHFPPAPAVRLSAPPAVQVQPAYPPVQAVSRPLPLGLPLDHPLSLVRPQPML